jgi:hypothetical protein
MDWNNDGKIDGRDYAHYKSVIDTGNSSSGSHNSSKNNMDLGTPTSVKIIIAIIIGYVILKLMGLD